MDIRRAVFQDYKTIFRLNSEVQNLHAKLYPHIFKKVSVNALSLKTFKKYLVNKSNILLIAYEKGRAVGYIFATVKEKNDDPLRYDARFININHLSVKNNYRRNGVATRLLNEIFKIARGKKIRTIQLDVWQTNKNALLFFKKKGFKVFNLKMEFLLKNK